MLAIVLATVAHGGTDIGSSRKFGLGIQLGEPSGLTGKVYTNGRSNAVDFTVGGGYYGEPFGPYGFAAQVAYHWHLETLASGGGVTIPFRIGVGGWFVTDYGWADDAYIGARVPFGVDFDLESAPFQFYIEAAFRLGVIPGFGAGVDAAIGARYYF
jgi:hypothetical protein